MKKIFLLITILLLMPIVLAEEKIVKTEYNMTIMDCVLEIRTAYDKADYSMSLGNCSTPNTIVEKEIIFVEEMECNGTVIQEIGSICEEVIKENWKAKFSECEGKKALVQQGQDSCDKDLAEIKAKLKNLTDISDCPNKKDEIQRSLTKVTGNYNTLKADNIELKKDLENEEDNKWQNMFIGAILVLVIMYLWKEKNKYFKHPNRKQLGATEINPKTVEERNQLEELMQKLNDNKTPIPTATQKSVETERPKVSVDDLMKDIDIDNLKCPLCGAKSNKKGERFKDKNAVRLHLTLAHKEVA